MNIFVIIIAAVLLIAIMLRLKAPVGVSVLGGGLLMWLLADRSLSTLTYSMQSALTQSRTYDLIFAFYFVMCLESELRLSKTLEGMVRELNHLFSSARLTTAIMPSFLGLLPSVGGALFSAPIVAQGLKDIPVTVETKAAINYWFRHVFESGSPTIPGMILAAGIAGVSLSSFVVHLLWFAIFFALVGWLLWLMPLKKYDQIGTSKQYNTESKTVISNTFLAISPIVINLLLMMAFDVSASIAMAIVAILLWPILHYLGRGVSLRSTFIDSINKKLFLNIACILYFISLLSNSGVLDQLVDKLNTSPLPLPVIFAILSLLIGLLTGMSQAFIAIVMPIANGVVPQDLYYMGLIMVFGLIGQMLTPVHLCFTISVNYFNASFSKVFLKVLLASTITLFGFTLVTYLTWPK